MGLPASHNLVGRSPSWAWPASWVLVNSECGQDYNQDLASPILHWCFCWYLLVRYRGQSGLIHLLVTSLWLKVFGHFFFQFNDLFPTFLFSEFTVCFMSLFIIRLPFADIFSCSVSYFLSPPHWLSQSTGFALCHMSGRVKMNQIQNGMKMAISEFKFV